MNNQGYLHQHKKGGTNPDDHYATLKSHVSPRFYCSIHKMRTGRNISRRDSKKTEQQKKQNMKQKTTWHWKQLHWLRIPTWKRPFHPQPAAENPPYSRHHGMAEMLPQERENPRNPKTQMSVEWTNIPPRSHWSTQLEWILLTTCWQLRENLHMSDRAAVNAEYVQLFWIPTIYDNCFAGHVKKRLVGRYWESTTPRCILG